MVSTKPSASVPFGARVASMARVYQCLTAIPFQANGHQLPTGHPFAVADHAPAPLVHRASGYAALETALHELPPGQAFYVGMFARIRELTVPCARCGLADWLVAADAVRPLLPCPFAEGPLETKVRIPVPSGKLAVGCLLISAGAPNAPAIEDGHDFSFIRSHHEAGFWASYGFAQLNIRDQGFRLVLPDGEGAFVLVDGPPVHKAHSVATLNMIMPTFACGDAERFYRRHQDLRKANLIQRDATLSSVVVPPGTYEITLFHEPQPFTDTSSDRFMAVRIARVGDVGADPFSSDPDVAARAFLEPHPWLSRSGADALNNAESALFEPA